jgi:hypothetical protein
MDEPRVAEAGTRRNVPRFRSDPALRFHRRIRAGRAPWVGRTGPRPPGCSESFEGARGGFRSDQKLRFQRTTATRGPWRNWSATVREPDGRRPTKYPIRSPLTNAAHPAQQLNQLAPSRTHRHHLLPQHDSATSSPQEFSQPNRVA